MATTKSMPERVLELAAKFVTRQKGTWEHDDWEAFLDEAGKLGLDLNDETRRNLGNILEAAKSFCVVEPAKKAAARRSVPKAKAKAAPKE